MNEPWLDSSASVLVIGTLSLALIAAVVTVRWGRRLPRRGDWLAGLGILSVIIVLLVTRRHEMSMPVEEVPAAVHGWVWPRIESDALRVGILRDGPGFAVSMIAAALSALFVLNRSVTEREPRQERLFAAALTGSIGMTLAWLSLTAWLAFGGILLTIFSGFLALGTHWDDSTGAGVAARYARERSAALLLSIFGAFALASSGVDLVLVAKASAPLPVGASLGGLLLVLGLFAQTQPFPMSGWLTLPSRASASGRIIFAQAFSAVAALAPLIRLEPLLRASGILQTLGWVSLVSTVLISFQGLFQADWRPAMSAWISASFGLTTCVLAFSGPWAAFSLLLAALFAAFVFTLLASIGADERNRFASRMCLLIAAATGAGLAGFVGFSGSLKSLVDVADNATLATALGLARFAVALLAWKLVWLVPEQRKPGAGHWSGLAIPVIVILASLGVFWTGSLTGGAIPGNPDQVMNSALNFFFGSPESGDAARVLTASSLLWGGVLGALAIAFWSSGRGEDRWLRIRGTLPRFASFIEEGYGADRFFGQLLRGATWLANQLGTWLDHALWGRWVPGAADWVLTRTSGLLNRADGGLIVAIHRGVHRGVHVPAKLLQLVQNGDLQWYLFFAIGSGIAIILHFLRF